MAKSSKSVSTSKLNGIGVIFLDLTQLEKLPDMSKLPGFLGFQTLTSMSVKRGISMVAAEGAENPTATYNGYEWYLTARASVKDSSKPAFAAVRDSLKSPAKVAAVAEKPVDADAFLSSFGLGK